MPAKPKKVHCEKKVYCLPQDVDHAVYTVHTSTQKSWLFILLLTNRSGTGLVHFFILGPGLRTRAVLLLVLLTNNIQLVGFFGHPIFILTHVNTSHGLCDVWEGSVIPGQLHTTYRFSIEF